MVDAAGDARASADDALAIAGALLGYVDMATTEASGAFLEAQQLLLADSDRVRRDLLEDLLSGRGPETPPASPRRATPGSTRTRRASSSPRCPPPRPTTTARSGAPRTPSRRRCATAGPHRSP